MGKVAAGVAYITEPPIIAISGNVAQGVYRSGGTRTKIAMPVKLLRVMHDRISRALERYAAGEDEFIIND